MAVKTVGRAARNSEKRPKKQPETTGSNRGKQGSKATQFKPGQSGNPNGRPKGARHKLDGRFLEALMEDFQVHGAAAIAECRKSKPEAYLTVITKVLPKVIDGKVDHDHSHDHTSESVSETTKWIREVLARHESKADDEEPN